MNKIAWSIAGWDPSAGAGVAADLKVFASWGLYGQGIISALTAQNTQAVEIVTPVEPTLFAKSLKMLREDNSVDAIKIGLLGSIEQIAIIAESIDLSDGIPIILDPVIRASAEFSMVSTALIGAIVYELLPRISWITPNLAELGVLTGSSVTDETDVEKHALQLSRNYGNLTVLVTGGHLNQPHDYLLCPGQSVGTWVPGDRVETTSTHGTGCTLSSALASILARWPTVSPEAAVRAAKRYVEGAMRNAPGIGRGHGPLNHFWREVPREFPAG